mgnify:CR=1 FL=1
MPGYDYTYTVAARNVYGSSVEATSNTVNTTPPPLAPIDLSAAALSHAEIGLEWVDMSDNETGFEIYRSENEIDYSLLTTVEDNITTYNDGGLSTFTFYSYKVRATGINGNSDFTPTVNVQTMDVAPQAPGNLTLASPSQNEVTVSWSDNSNNEDGFRIFRKEGDDDFVMIAETDENITIYQDIDVSPLNIYGYEVRAFNEIGDSGGVTAEILVEVTEIPEAPLSLVATFDAEAKIVQLTWTDNAEYEDGFEIFRTDKGDAAYAAVGKDVSVFVDNNLSANLETYEYRVRAFNAVGTSVLSDAASVTVPITSLDDAYFGEIEVFPNPVTDQFMIKNYSSTTANIIVFSVLGTSVTKVIVPAFGDSIVVTRDWAAGVYMINGRGFKPLRIIRR